MSTFAQQTHEEAVAERYGKSPHILVSTYIKMIDNDGVTIFICIKFCEQHTLFVRWLQFEQVRGWEKVRDLNPSVIRMDWQTRDNCVDCGIFVMRHMETYMGRNKWSRRLTIESVSLL